MSSHAKNHDYHIVNPSVWPFLGAVGAFVMLVGAITWFHGGTPIIFLLGLAVVLFTMYVWWSDVIREAKAGDHTPVVNLGLRYGFILFIISEVFFFLAWFWAYFHYVLFPPAATEVFERGGAVPPEGIHVVDPWGLPLINTLILLLSGCTLTWAHHALLEDDRKGLKNGLIWTVVLGAIFLFLQGVEYYEAYHHGLALQTDWYGATFFMATGFHGMHVLIGTIFLFTCLLRVNKGQFTKEKHIGFEAAAWYWHFVDVVWLFLFAMIYLGSAYFFHIAPAGGAH